MKEDNFLQQQVESGKDDGSVDATAYRKVFEVLRKESGPALPPSFADTIVVMVQQRNSSSASRLVIFLALIGGIFAIALLVIATILTGFKLQLGFLEPIRHFGGMFLFGTLFILMLNWIDKILIRKKVAV